MAFKDYSNIVLGTKKKREDEEEEKISSGTKDYSSVVEKRILSKDIGLDTLESDLATLGKTVDGIYNGWQTAETMANTKVSVENMYKRIGAYEDYRKKYGGTDLSELYKGYEEILGGWDDRASMYSRYKNADSYNNEQSTLAKLNSMNSDEISKHIKDVSDLEGILGEANKYVKIINEATDKRKAYDDPRNVVNVDGGHLDKQIESTKAELNDYLSGFGFNSVDELKKAISDKKIAYTTVGGQNITWQNLYDQKKYEEDHNALYSELTSSEEFDRYRQIGEDIENPTYNDVEKANSGFFPKKTDIPNPVKYAKENKAQMTMSAVNASDYVGDVMYSEISNEEYDIYNFYLGQELEGKIEKGTAQKYLDSIYGKLKDRSEDRWLSATREYATEHPVAASIASVGMNLFAPAEYIRDTVNYAKTGELDTNLASAMSTSIRSTVSENVDWNIGKFDAFDFVYNTGMSMVDSATSMALYGSLGGVSLGMSAAAQGTNDALNRGLDNKSAFWNGFSSGVFEMAFETLSIGHFKALKEVPVDSFKTSIKNLGKSMLVNASEETLTELANIGYDMVANGSFSDYETRIRAYMNSGMSESDAKKKVALELGGQVAEAGASGALMGFGFGAVAQAQSYANSTAIGSKVRNNDRVGDMFGLANNPEMASAYEAYTNYANKGITSDNVSNAQLGNLYRRTYEEADATYKSTESTAEQKASAKKTLDDLEVYVQSNPSANVSKSKIKSSYDAEMVDALISEGLESGEGTDSYRLATEYKAKIEGGKALSVKEIDSLIKANEKAFKHEETADITSRLEELGESGDVAKLSDIISRKVSGERITSDEAQALKDNKVAHQVLLENTNEEIVELSKTMEKADADLFLEVYDGQTDAEAYANAFNLVSDYARYNYDQDFILENKSVLSAEQAMAIYKNVRIAEDKADAEAKAKLRETMKSMKGARGVIIDSVIDYENTSAKGKVNWNSLNPRQQQAVTFTKGLFKALGSNLVFVAKNKNFNGMYHVSGNTVYVDVYAGMDVIKGLGKDAIIPTASHELTHEMEVYSPDTFKSMADAIFDALESVDHISRGDRIAAEIKRLDEKHPEEGEHSEKDAISEIVARACEDMLSVSEEGKRLFNSLSESEQKTLVDKIKEIVQRIKDWINDFLSSYKSTSKEAQELRSIEGKLDEVVKLWDEMLLDIQKQNQENDGTLVENLAEARDLQYNDRLVEKHIDMLKTNYSSESALELDEILDRYNKIVEIWRRLGAEQNCNWF